MPLHPSDLRKMRSRTRKGDVAEAAFLAKAMQLGFNVCKPFGTACRFDFVVEAGGRLSRVQVKSSWGNSTRHHAYCIGLAVAQPQRGPRTYQRHELDFLAAYIAQEDAWYVIPAREIAGRTRISVYPHRPQAANKYENYRDAWHLLVGRRGIRIDLEAMAEDAIGDPYLLSGQITMPPSHAPVL
jgi:hypothetical protein